jgi:CheY-like chemotaxis protein
VRLQLPKRPQVERIHLVVIDDNRLVREGLKALLDAMPDLKVVAIAEDSTTGLRHVRELTPQVVLMDATLDNGDSARSVETLRKTAPGTKVIMMDLLAGPEDVIETQESFSLVLSRPSGAQIVDGTGTADIGADPPLPTVSVSDAATVSEPTGTAKVYAEFTVSLSHAYAKKVTVKVKSGTGTATKNKDFAALSTTVTFNPGQTSKVVRVRVLKDKLAEPAEQLSVVLSSPSRAVLADAMGTGTIAVS